MSIHLVCWMVISAQSERTWMARCLDFGTLAQAGDPESAAMLVLDGTNEAVASDLRRDERLARRWDDDQWEHLAYILSGGETHASFETLLADLARREIDPTHVLIASVFVLSYQQTAAGFRCKVAKTIAPLHVCERGDKPGRRKRPSSIAVQSTSRRTRPRPQ